LQPLLDDEALHQVSQNLPPLRPRPRLPGTARRLVGALGLVSRLAEKPRLCFGRAPRPAEGGPSGEEGGRIFCRGGEEGRGGGGLGGEAGQRWEEQRQESIINTEISRVLF